jgi:hypothetical protein
MAGSLYIYDLYPLHDRWNSLWEEHGKDKICLYNHEWFEILEGPFFDSIEKSWLSKEKSETIFSCITTCASASTVQVNDPSLFGELNQKL